MNANKVIDSQDYTAQITQVLYKSAGGAIIGSVVNIALVAFVLSEVYPTISLLTWFCSGQILNLIRWFTLVQYNNSPQKYSAYTWLQLHRVLTFLSGALYGILAIFFLSSEIPIYQILVILLVGGMGAAAVGTHGVDNITFRSFLLAAILPLIGRCIYEDNHVYTTVALMLCLLIVIMIKSANHTQKIMLDNIRMSESLRYRATHDGLVGLLNREEFKRAFDKKTNANIKLNNNNLLSIIFIDLDNFKKLNDTLGHLEGDKALIEIGEIIRHCIRKTDIAARFGGDEFMILLESTSIDEPNLVAEKVLDRIQDFNNNMNHEFEPSLGASIGIGYSDDQEVSFSQLLQAADQACYKAKHAGKGKIFQKKVASP